jgi:adenylosuccinate synthase
MKQLPRIVVGLGYGDEGKGRTVDFLCSKVYKPLVVRFSGGQQCGHTVMAGGIKHIFSNLGSGTLRGAPTYFTEHTTIYPSTMQREILSLKEKGIDNCKVVIHPLANLTTPFDVLANRSCKSNLSHGSCGLGIGKTMKRQIESPYKVYALDLLNPSLLFKKMDSIGKWYGIDPNEHKEYISIYVKAVKSMEWDIQDYSYLRQDDISLIFEGSQGVLLDKDHGVFPHVTYSNTTSKNAIEVCKLLGFKKCYVYGITRTYHTRHGNGPFEETPLNLKNTEDEINITNKFQGDFKVGKMDYELLKQAIRTEKIYSGELEPVFVLAVTCYDQWKDFDEFRVSEGKTLMFDEIIKFESPRNH